MAKLRSDLVFTLPWAMICHLPFAEQVKTAKAVGFQELTLQPYFMADCTRAGLKLKDMKVDAGMVPVTELQVLETRWRAASAIQAVFDELGFPKIADAEVDAATEAYASGDMPERDLVADLAAADGLLDGPLSSVDVIMALDRRGFTDIAANVLGMQRARIIGDYLQPAAILDKTFKVESAFSDPNDYRGPGTGFRLDGEDWREIADIPQAKRPRDLVPLTNSAPGVSLEE
jgi:propanediol dehydratase large subunit